MGHSQKPESKTAPLLDRVREFDSLLEAWAEAELPFRTVQKHVGELYVLAALRREKGNQCKAAQRIGIHRNTLPRIIGSRAEVRKLVSKSKEVGK